MAAQVDLTPRMLAALADAAVTDTELGRDVEQRITELFRQHNSRLVDAAAAIATDRAAEWLSRMARRAAYQPYTAPDRSQVGHLVALPIEFSRKDAINADLPGVVVDIEAFRSHLEALMADGLHLHLDNRLRRHDRLASASYDAINAIARGLMYSCNCCRVQVHRLSGIGGIALRAGDPDTTVRYLVGLAYAPDGFDQAIFPNVQDDDLLPLAKRLAAQYPETRVTVHGPMPLEEAQDYMAELYPGGIHPAEVELFDNRKPVTDIWQKSPEERGRLLSGIRSELHPYWYGRRGEKPTVPDATYQRAAAIAMDMLQSPDAETVATCVSMLQECSPRFLSDADYGHLFGLLRLHPERFPKRSSMFRNTLDDALKLILDASPKINADLLGSAVEMDDNRELKCAALRLLAQHYPGIARMHLRHMAQHSNLVGDIAIALELLALHFPDEETRQTIEQWLNHEDDNAQCVAAHAVKILLAKDPAIYEAAMRRLETGATAKVHLPLIAAVNQHALDVDRKRTKAAYRKYLEHYLPFHSHPLYGTFADYDGKVVFEGYARLVDASDLDWLASHFKDVHTAHEETLLQLVGRIDTPKALTALQGLLDQQVERIRQYRDSRRARFEFSAWLAAVGLMRQPQAFAHLLKLRENIRALHRRAQTEDYSTWSDAHPERWYYNEHAVLVTLLRMTEREPQADVRTRRMKTIMQVAGGEVVNYVVDGLTATRRHQSAFDRPTLYRIGLMAMEAGHRPNRYRFEEALVQLVESGEKSEDNFPALLRTIDFVPGLRQRAAESALTRKSPPPNGILDYEPLFEGLGDYWRAVRAAMRRDESGFRAAAQSLGQAELDKLKAHPCRQVASMLKKAKLAVA